MWYMCFNVMLPYTAWKERKPYLAVGDFVLLGWEPKLGKGHYRLARVCEVKHNKSGQVKKAYRRIKQ